MKDVNEPIRALTEERKKRNGGRTEKQRGKAESIFVISFDPECLFGSD